MTQRDRDRLVVLKQVQKRQLTQQQAGEQLGYTERHVRRLLKKLKGEGDKAILHGLRGRPSNRRRSAKEREAIVRILSQEVYRGFGPTLAAEYLAQKHKIEVGREALRQIGPVVARQQAPSGNGASVAGAQVVPANPIDVHRPLGPQHDLAASLSVVTPRQVANDYTIRFEAKVYQIARQDIRPGLRGASVRIESRLDGTLQVRFQQHYLAVSPCPLPPQRKLEAAAVRKLQPARAASSASKQQHHAFLAAPALFPLWKAALIDRTRTTDTLEE